MVENSTSTAPTAPPAPSSEAPGQPYYERERQRLKALLAKRQTLERNLQATEDAIYKKETEYLEDTPQGNIITGFDAYTKGSSVAPGGGRRRGQAQDMNRVFTRSSISFRTDLVRGCGSLLVLFYSVCCVVLVLSSCYLYTILLVFLGLDVL